MHKRRKGSCRWYLAVGLLRWLLESVHIAGYWNHELVAGYQIKAISSLGICFKFAVNKDRNIRFREQGVWYSECRIDWISRREFQWRGFRVIWKIRYEMTEQFDMQSAIVNEVGNEEKIVVIDWPSDLKVSSASGKDAARFRLLRLGGHVSFYQKKTRGRVLGTSWYFGNNVFIRPNLG